MNQWNRRIARKITPFY